MTKLETAVLYTCDRMDIHMKLNHKNKKKTKCRSMYGFTRESPYCRVMTTVSSATTKDPRLTPRMSNESNDTISLMSLSSHQSLHLDNNQTITNPVPNIEIGKIDSRQETATENVNRVQKLSINGKNYKMLLDMMDMEGDSGSSNTVKQPQGKKVQRMQKFSNVSANMFVRNRMEM